MMAVWFWGVISKEAKDVKWPTFLIVVCSSHGGRCFVADFEFSLNFFSKYIY